MVTPGINPHNPSPRKYFKSNYVDAVEMILPSVYTQDEITASGFETKKEDQIINTHLRLAGLMSSPTSGVVYLSSVPETSYSSIGNLAGASQYFISQNNNTKITPQSFERDILIPTGRSLNDFSSSASFYEFLAGSSNPFLSSISNYAVSDSYDRTKGVYASDAAETHIHLINSLSWLYFLNLSGNAADGHGTAGYTYQPSSIVADLLVKKTYAGKTIYLDDALKALSEFVFLNYETCAAWQDQGLITDDFLPSGVRSGYVDGSLSSTWISGIQPLDNLKTLISVIYSPQETNLQDTKVKNAFQDYIDNATLLASLETKGPLHRLLKAFSYSMFDRLNEAETLNLLYDIEDCPSEYLPYLGDLIGWKLYGTDDTKRRLQLKNAVNLYKKTGTKASIQEAVNALFSEDVFDVSGDIKELWESYIPNLIYYALATESSMLKDFTTWNSASKKLGVVGYSTSSMDENIRLAVDHILLYLVILHPNLFKLGGEPFPITILSGANAVSSVAASASLSAGPIVPGMSLFLSNPTFVFNYRNRNFPIPPWEKASYYTDCEVTDNLIDDLRDLLTCFGVSENFSNIVREYIKDNTLRVDDSVRDNNGWLILTSSVNHAPNLSSVLLDPISNNVDVFSMWNGKSSHFKLIMVADSFDFSKNSFTHDSKYAPQYAARLAKDFSPAHAISESRLEASGIDDYVVRSVSKWIIRAGVSADDYDWSSFSLSEAPPGGAFGWSPTGTEKKEYPVALARTGVSAVHMNAFRRRGSNAGDARGLKRTDVNRVHLIHSGIVGGASVAPESDQSVGGIVKVPRNAIRRRNYKPVLPTKGYYDRTGFNMPISWDPSTIEFSYVGGTKEPGGVYEHLFSNFNEGSGFGFLPLGYIASAGHFAPITDYMNLPPVYGRCEDLTSPNIFSGVVISSTFPCRGLSSLGADDKHTQYRVSAANYVDRYETPSIIVAMHRIQERRKVAKASYYVNSNFSSFSNDYTDMEAELNFANSSTESNGWFPDSIGDYHNFKFDRGLHQLYKVYTKDFYRHPLGESIYDLDGPTINGHLYGSGIFNGNFNVLGPSSVYHKTAANSAGLSLVASSFSTASSLTLQSLAFSGILEPGGNWTGADPTIGGGSYAVSAGLIASSVFNISGGVVSSLEIRNRNILSGMDFIHVSGSDPANGFELYNIASQNARNSGNNYYIANPLIKLKSVRGLSRLRFSLNEASGLRAYSILYPRDDNSLIKDNKYRVSVRHIGGTENGKFVGGVSIGVWIHTEIENNAFWSYTPKGKWEQRDASSISEGLILGELSHTYKMPVKPISRQITITTKGRPGLCGNTSLNTVSSTPALISEFSEEDYYTMNVDFHTFNEGLERRELAIESYGTEFTSRPSMLPSKLVNHFDSSRYEIHNTNQHYVFEFFMLPASQNRDKYVILDHIGLTNLTLNEKLTYDVSGDVSPLHFDTLRNSSKDTYTREDVRDIFNFFNSIVGVNHYSPYASRVASETENLFGTSGGGRLSYRSQPEYYTFVRASNFNNLTSLEIVN